MKFPVDVSGYKPLKFKIDSKSLSAEDKEKLKVNIQIVRDTIVFFTSLAKAKGVGGHTGGAYDVVPEYLIAEAFSRGDGKVYPVFYDEAGHRVAIQYAMAAINGEFPIDKLLTYREFKSGLPGHPEFSLGTAKFDSGRLGHMWGEVNGVAMANPDKNIVMLGSDGSFMEGNDAEAARLAVAMNLNVKVLFDDNNITIAGHPTDYMKGFSLDKTLKGHGMGVEVVDHSKGEDLDALYSAILKAITTDGPVGVVSKRLMAVGIKGVENTSKAHDALDPKVGIEYFKERGNSKAVSMLEEALGASKPKGKEYLGSSSDKGSCRKQFGQAVSDILSGMKDKEIIDSLRVFDPDLEGSTGLSTIKKVLEEKGVSDIVYHNIGPQERGGVLAAGGFGAGKGKQGIFATFGAFSEMVISELNMLKMRKDRNILIHFSHSSEDDMSDNTCHFGWNIMLLDSGIPEEKSIKIYFGADADQTDAIVKKVYSDQGVRVVCSTRSKTPFILDGDKHKYGSGYKFTGKDEVVKEGKDGYIIAYGDMVYRALDAIEKAKAEGLNVGLINHPTLNVVDEDTMKKVSKVKFVLLVESQNYNTGVGVRFADWLAERGISVKYNHMGATKSGLGGQSEQIPYQGLDSEHILAKIKEMAK